MCSRTCLYQGLMCNYQLIPLHMFIVLLVFLIMKSIDCWCFCYFLILVYVACCWNSLWKSTRDAHERGGSWHCNILGENRTSPEQFTGSSLCLGEWCWGKHKEQLYKWINFFPPKCLIDITLFFATSILLLALYSYFLTLIREKGKHGHLTSSR